MKKDVFAFYSGLLDKEIELPVSIMTPEEFFQYYDELNHDMVEFDVNPKPLKASTIRQHPEILTDWVTKSNDYYRKHHDDTRYHTVVFAVTDDSKNTEYDDNWFCTGYGYYDENGELQYTFC